MYEREAEVNELCSWLLVEPSLLPDTIWISGGQSSGKTFVLDALMKYLNVTTQYSTVLIDCTAISSFKELLQELYSEIHDTDQVRLTTSEILHSFKQLKKTLVILDHSDSLLEEKCNQLMCVPELVAQKISLVIVSRYHPHYFSEPSLMLPIHIHLDMYTENQCIEIVKKGLNTEVDATVLSFYIQSMVALMYAFNPDLFLIRKLVHKHLKLFLKPLEEGVCGARDLRRLWALFEPNVVSKTNEGSLAAPQLQTLSCLDRLPRDKVADCTLPFDSNYIITAAYLASYNPATSDTRFFVKQRMAKKPPVAKSNVKLCHVTGPKAFVLERLLAIFYAIHDEPDRCVLSNIFSQISSLVSKNYLVRQGIEMLDQPKYICVAKYEFVAKCAKQINFDLNEHLYDFTVGACANV